MNCLVTGGVGFIGSAIARALLARGDSVAVLDNVSPEKKLEGVRYWHGDIRDASLVEKAMVGVDVVFHEAAAVSVPRSIRLPVETAEVNVMGTLNVLEAAKDVAKVIFASSSSVYGSSEELPKTEHMSPNPASPYALSKLAAEDYCRLYSSLYGSNVVILRYFNVFGPGQNPRGLYSAVIPKFASAILKGEAVVVYGDGEQTRDFTYVDNVVEANLLAASPKGISGQVINIGCGKATSVNELLVLMADLMGRQPEVRREPVRSGDVRHSVACIQKAKALLGYNPTVSLYDGLEATIHASFVHN